MLIKYTYNAYVVEPRFQKPDFKKPKKNNKIGTNGVYCRLSRDDGIDGESNSIISQKTLLSQKANEKGLTDTKFYVDGGA